MMRKGLYKGAPAFPYIPGYDVAGVVDAVGEGCASSMVGTEVFALTRFGGYAEYVVTRMEGVAAVPKGISPAVATALATQYCTAMYAVNQCPNLRNGHKALVHAAAGGVGIALVQILTAMGVEVTGTAGSEHKLAIIKGNGAKEAINYRQNDYADLLLQRKEKFMAVFNPIGGKTYKKDRKLIMPGGQHVLFGGSDRTSGRWGILSSLAFVQRMGLLIPIALMMKSQGITGVNMLHIADHHPELLSECLKKVSDWAEKGVLKPQIHKIYSVNELSVAHNELENRSTTGKLVVSWN